MEHDWTSALARARAHSPYLARLLERQGDLAALLERGEGERALAQALRAGEETADVPAALRQEKAALGLVLAIGDLAGAFPLETVTRELSAFADRALDRAITHAAARFTDGTPPSGFIALALGKHGARELNYSSDIDPILLYDPETLPRRPRSEPGETAQRMARRVVETLSQQTADGYVFRVDLRLRPASEVSPLAVPLGAALTHYESSALAWERAAFIRARACAGDREAGEDFLAAIQPFVWRRSLDFGAIDDIRRLTHRIREAHEGPREAGPDYDLKKGRGGIREIEFYAQTHQLIHGGRDPGLRLRETIPALQALAEAGHIEEEAARDMAAAYRVLRTVEHRLQMVADRQTHNLPGNAEALDNVARLHGLSQAGALVAEVADHTARVARHFDVLLAEDESGDFVPERLSLRRRAEDLGFAAPDDIALRIQRLLDGGAAALRSEAGRAGFEAIAPDLIGALAQAPDPDAAFTRMERLVAALPTGVNLFRLLAARPGLMDQLVRIVNTAPPLAEELARRPDLLDPLIDASAFALPGAVTELATRMTPADPQADHQARLDRIRRVVGEKRFVLGVQLVEAAQPPLAVAQGLSRVAEAAVVAGAEAAEREFAAAHGRTPEGELLVLALGRLGGGALTHASDLDLIYLFTGGLSAESDGPRPLGATLYFNRLAQRVTAALGVPTAEGALYEVDTRLRPQGNQGPLAASLEAFARYQREDAWTWEHMALARARVIYGSPAARAELGTLVGEVLRQERDPGKLREDVLAMRAEMAQHKPPSGPLDVKLRRGGLVDCEFLIHFLQLRDAKALDPDLSRAAGMLAQDGSLSAEFPPAHDALSAFLVAARLLAPDGSEPPPAAQAALARACGAENYTALLQNLAEARQCIARDWQAVFGETLETEI